MKSLRVSHGELPAYVAPCLKILRRWRVTAAEVKSLPRKGLEERIVTTVFAASLTLKDCPGSVMREGLNLINSDRIPLKFRDLTWLTFHGKLYVRGNLKLRPLADRGCPRVECGSSEETMEHFLLHCPFNREVYKRVGRALGIPFLDHFTYAEWAYGGFQSHLVFDLSTLFLVSVVVRYFTWNARCQVSLRQKVLPVEVVVHDILHEVGKIRALEKEKGTQRAWMKAWRHIRSSWQPP